jgi:hypothetical protein
VEVDVMQEGEGAKGDSGLKNDDLVVADMGLGGRNISLDHVANTSANLKRSNTKR